MQTHLPTQADQLRTRNSVREQMVPKIETGIIDITPNNFAVSGAGGPHVTSDTHANMDSPKVESPPNAATHLQGDEGNFFITVIGGRYSGIIEHYRN